MLYIQHSHLVSQNLHYARAASTNDSWFVVLIFHELCNRSILWRFCYAVLRNPIPPSKRDYFMHDQAVGVQTRGYRCRAAVPRWLQHVLEEFPMRLGVPPRHVSPYIFALEGHLCANFEYPISAVQHRAGYGVWAEPAEETAQII
jgi:hypothetical protein